MLEQRAGGFTLLEMMVAMALLALVAGLLFSSGRLLMSAQDRLDERQDAVSDRVIGLELMRARLAQAMQLDFGDAEGHVAAFTGDPNSLRFIAPRADEEPGHPLLAWEFRIAEIEGQGVLETRLADHPVMARDFAALDRASWRPLFKVRQELAFAYHGRAEESGDEAAWHDSWHGQPRMPEAVRLAGTGEPSAVVPAVMRLRTTTPPLCGSGRIADPAGCGD